MYFYQIKIVDSFYMWKSQIYSIIYVAPTGVPGALDDVIACLIVNWKALDVGGWLVVGF